VVGEMRRTHLGLVFLGPDARLAHDFHGFPDSVPVYDLVDSSKATLCGSAPCRSSASDIRAIFTALVGPSCRSKPASRTSFKTCKIRTPPLHADLLPLHPASIGCPQRHAQHYHRTTSSSPSRQSMTVNGPLRTTHLPQKPDPLKRRPPLPIPYESRWTRRPLLLLL
jgi:hypothetical protein